MPSNIYRQHLERNQANYAPLTPLSLLERSALVMTAIEVYLTYQNMQPIRMLSILMGLSLLKAALIIGYFMHMKFEVSRMKWLTMASLVVCLALMMIFFPDALRILSLGVK